ncbi:MAG TPA: FliM/FliN family flagellar motor switch protein [Gemmatimonadales bacterium]|nr:FliM/FliN family flagellar motor switch protein [Gemmatimonadales bacterium]
MVDFISQNDVDSILSGSSVGTPKGGPPVEAETYNFLRPHRISKDRRSTLHVIYGRFAVALQSLLTSRLRQLSDVSVASVEQATFGEFIMSLNTPCSAFLFDLGDGSGFQGVLDLGNELAYQLIDRMFGGPGISRDLNRSLTPLERLVLKGVVDHALGYYGEAWHDHLPIKPKQVGFESIPDQLAIARREDNVLVANIDVKTPGFTGLLTVCLPLIALESFLQEKRATITRGARSSEAERQAARAAVDSSIRAAQVLLTARFPVFSMRARDVAALQVGQVIRTGYALDVPIEVQVSGRRRFLAAPGRVRNTAGVRITAVIPAGQAEGKVHVRAKVI